MAGQGTTPGHASGKARTQRLCLFLLAVLFTIGCRKEKPPPPPPPEVQFITLAPTNVPIIQEWIGTLDGYVNAQIRAQVSGYLLTQNYAEGSRVTKGDLLFQIDPRPFQAVLDEAKARLAQDEAQLEKTRLDVERFTPLAKTKAVSQQDLDNAVQAHAAAQAQVKADHAAIETAELNLGFTRITSPVDGLAGVAHAQVGDLVGPSSDPLTIVSTVDPIKANFQVSERSYLTFWKQFSVSNEDTQSDDLALELVLSDGSTFPTKGRFFFADRQINPNTGTLQITGLFSNQNTLLRPGQFARIRAQTQIRTNTLLVPQRAVTELQGTYQVFAVGESNKISVVPIKVGPQIGTAWIVEQGLKPGMRVVVEGTQKSKAGAVVTPKPFAGLTNNPPTRQGSF